MENGKQPINPTRVTRTGDGENDFRALKHNEATGYERHLSGLTKREEFARSAMQGLLSNPEWMNIHQKEKYLMQSKIVAEVAIRMADELLKQLEDGI